MLQVSISTEKNFQINGGGYLQQPTGLRKAGDH